MSKSLPARLRESASAWVNEIDTRLEAADEIERLEAALAEQRQINANITEAARKESIRAGDLEAEVKRLKPQAEAWMVLCCGAEAARATSPEPIVPRTSP